VKLEYKRKACRKPVLNEKANSSRRREDKLLEDDAKKQVRSYTK
jgi:hypothetical protein